MTYPLHVVPLGSTSGRTSALYLKRGDEPAATLAENADVTITAGGRVSSDTYFGAFPLEQWVRICGLSQLGFSIEIEGAGTVQIRAMGTVDTEDSVLAEQKVSTGTTGIDLSAALGTAAPALYFTFTASEPSTLKAARFTTADAPRRRVDLGLVVTTFRRVADVTQTIHRLQSQIDGDPETVFGSLRLVVVDNGEELDASAFPGTLVLPNPNMGGAGGFARGLLHLMDEAGSTHGCFMDDDASTEEECILRTRRFLSYARDERTAISAAMLQSETDHMVHEQGAIFEWKRGSRIISRKHGRDLLKRTDLVEVLKPEPIGYGGWWFFAFPITPDMRFPYPMFVRGDDWLFSYLNSFDIQTPLGIASWQDSFAGKLAPTEQYLAYKAFLVMELIARDADSFAASEHFFRRWIDNNLGGYCYDRAAMNIEALKDVLKGPSFWAENVLLGARLQTLKPLVTAESYSGGPRTAERKPRWRYRHGLRRRVRELTRNGHVLPERLLKKPLALDKLHAPSPESAFLFSGVDYVDTATGKVFAAKRDAPRYFKLHREASGLIGELSGRFKDLRAGYLASVDTLCTAAWWREQISRPKT